MRRPTEFTLKDGPVYQKGRELCISKAYSGKDFLKKTVLTDEVFTYVDFFYSSHHKAMKFVEPKNKEKFGNPNQFGYAFYWNQARIFYDAACSLPIESAPVAAYYCMLNAAKSYISYTSSSADEFVNDFAMHGINEDNADSGNDLSTISIKHKERGVFPMFAKCLDDDFLAKWPTGTAFSLKKLLYNLPFVHRAFSLTYSTRSKKVEEIFVPLPTGESPKYYKASDGKVYLAADLERTYFPVNAQTIPAAVLSALGSGFQLYGNSGFRIRSSVGARYNKDSISGELKELTDKLRKHFAYILGPKRLWYVKLSDSESSNVLNLSTLTINMAAMHRISEIARYKPEQLSRLMKSKENWLLHEYISLSLDQFIDEVAAQITKHDIMATGQK